MRFKKIFITTILLVIATINASSQDVSREMVVAAYYTGDGTNINTYSIGKLTHIIYSFLHLKGNKLAVDNVNDSLAITRLVALKANYPDLKIILSLGGWGGCKSCSEVFSTASGRLEFAQSVLQLMKTYRTDGIDLDWEYPVLESLPGHQYIPEDRQNFTYLVQTLRETLGSGYQVTFAAGGFRDYLEKSVEWNKVMPLVDYVYMMNYDLVNGNSTTTGHLTSLYSTPGQRESTDHAVMFLDSIGVPMNKIVIGLAFYGRTFEKVDDENHGLYQKGKFSSFIPFKDIDEKLGKKSGYEQYWDNKAKAAYAYNKTTRTFATYENIQSVYYKTKYARDHKLAGVMFWELMGDKPTGGLLDMIYEAGK